MTTHPKPARVDLGDGDSLILYRTSDHHTTVRFHSANPNTQLAGAVMETDALRAALDEVASAGSYARTDEPHGTPGCEDEHEGYLCTREDGHTGPHIAATFVLNNSVGAVWGEQPRPLTPDDIADEMVERYLNHRDPDEVRDWRLAGYRDDLVEKARAHLVAALTEPTRPEGAYELETVIGCNAGKWTNGPEDVRALADLLASNGVRVTGAES